MDASQFAILEKEIELEKIQASMLEKKEFIMKNELELLKAKSSTSGFPAPQITINDLKKAKFEKPTKVYAIMNGARKGIYTTYPDINESEIVKEFATEFEAKYVLNSYLGPQTMKNDYKDAILSISQPKQNMQVIGQIQATVQKIITQPIVRKDCSDITEDQ